MVGKWNLVYVFVFLPSRGTCAPHHLALSVEEAQLNFKIPGVCDAHCLVQRRPPVERVVKQR
jgi:hypothetical protein